MHKYIVLAFLIFSLAVTAETLRPTKKKTLSSTDESKNHLLKTIVLENVEIDTPGDEPISPSGETLAFGVTDPFGKSFLMLHDWDSGNARRLPLPEPAQMLAWSVDGTKIAILTAQNKVLLVDVPAFQISRTFEDFGQKRATAFCWLEKNEELFLGFTDGTVGVLPHESGAAVKAPGVDLAQFVPHGGIKDLSCSSKGSRVAVRSASVQDDIWSVDFARNKAERVVNTSRDGFYTFSLSNDGKKLLCDSGDLFQVIDLDSKQLAPLPNVSKDSFALHGSWAPDNNHLVVAIRNPLDKLRQRIRIVDLQAGTDKRIAASKDFDPAIARFFPDSEVVLSQTKTGTLQILSAETLSRDLLKRKLAAFSVKVKDVSDKYRLAYLRALIEQQKGAGLTKELAHELLPKSPPGNLKALVGEAFPK